jgi:hypothetical protein
VTTARELKAQLDERYRTDPEYRASVDSREAELRARTDERTRKLAPFSESLAKVGITETYDRMSGERHSDPRIFEAAFEHLSKPGYDDWTRAEIARSFETRGAARHWDRLEALYLAAEGDDERDALAAALAASARSVHVDELKRLVRIKRLGTSRLLLLRPINRLDRKTGRDFVLSLLDDPDLTTEADRIRRRVAQDG